MVLLREIAIYILANYAKDSPEKIAEAFHRNAKDILAMQNNQELETKYEKELDAFFAPLVFDYLTDSYLRLSKM